MEYYTLSSVYAVSINTKFHLRGILEYHINSDGVGCQKSGSGRVRVSLPRVRVGFGCYFPGFRSGSGIICRVSGFFGFQKMNKMYLKFVLSSNIFLKKFSTKISGLYLTIF